jgi:acylphosphatase
VEIIRRHAIVRGSVQGVGFRMNARFEARRLGLVGSAANLPDGSVEVEAEGPLADVETFLDWLRRGPRFAEVTSVIVIELEPIGEHSFEVW